MRKVYFAIIAGVMLLALTACQAGPTSNANGKKSIVVTYSVLGALVKDLVGNQANVIVSIPNGLDPHEWEPSARDIETINKADLVIENGLGLEGGLAKTLQTAKSRGVIVFTASDHVTIRHVGNGEGIPSGDPDQMLGAADPHLWMDPLAMKSIVNALTAELKNDFNLDVTTQAGDLENRLDNLNQEVAGIVAAISVSERKLVTGHESMGYFAQRYEFKLVGVIVPSLSSEAEVSASDLASIKQVVLDNGVRAIFAELGTSAAVSKAIGDETGVKVIMLATHAVPDDGSYFTYLKNMATVITNGLK